MKTSNSVWVYNYPSARFPCAVFDTAENAHSWIMKNKISGTLTCYPINMSVYDWAIENQIFTPQKKSHSERKFIGSFTSASQEHYHYVFDDNGVFIQDESSTIGNFI
jgi:hypothetical protein